MPKLVKVDKACFLKRCRSYRFEVRGVEGYDHTICARHGPQDEQDKKEVRP